MIKAHFMVGLGTLSSLLFPPLLFLRVHRASVCFLLIFVARSLNVHLRIIITANRRMDPLLILIKTRPADKEKKREEEEEKAAKKKKGRGEKRQEKEKSPVKVSDRAREEKLSLSTCVLFSILSLFLSSLGERVRDFVSPSICLSFHFHASVSTRVAFSTTHTRREKVSVVTVLI